MLKKSLLTLAITAATTTSLAQTGETITVIGKGQTRQVQTLLPENLEVLPPGASVQKALNILPGVNAQAIDALGVNEQSLSLSVRSFSTTRLGYTLDGMPLGDGAYNNYNGLSISRALISENLGRADLSVGIGNLGIASTSNLGGALTYVTDNPESELGFRVSQSFGSDANQRTFARVDTGEHGGFSAYLSGMYSESELFVNQDAYNTSTGEQFNGKVVYRADFVTLTAFADISRTSQANDFYLSKDALGRLGWDWGGYAPDWTTAVARAYCRVTPATPASTAGCISEGPAGDRANEAYGFTGGQVLRDDDLYYLAGDFDLSEDLSVRAQVYSHENKGAGNNWNHGWSSGQTVPWILRDTRYTIDRSGGLASINWNIGSHTVQAGFWVEDNTSSAERYNFTNVTGPRSLDLYLEGRPNTGTFAQETDWSTKQYYVQDTVRLFDDNLTVDFGFKSTDAQSDAKALPGIALTPIPATSSGQFATGTLKAKDSFLPQAGLRFQLAPEHEVFASYAQNISMFQGGFKLGPQAVSQAVWDSQGAPLKPESSKSLEGGYRLVLDGLQASIAVYQVDFDNRLLQYNPCNSREPNGPTCGNRFYNVGGVESRGVELAALWEPLDWLSWYNSISLNKSTYNDDYTQAGVRYATGGKQQVDTPKQMFASVLTLRHGDWHVSLQGKYTSERYYTYTNDQGFGGFTLFDLSASYDFGTFMGAKSAKLSLNVTNLLDKRYVSNLDSSVFAPVDPAGTIVVAHPGAPRQVFGTLSVAF